MSLNHVMGDVGAWMIGFGVWGTVLGLRELVLGLLGVMLGLGVMRFGNAVNAVLGFGMEHGGIAGW